MVASDDYRDVGEAAWSWVLSQVRGDQGPWLPDTVPDDQPPAGPTADRDSLYAGIAGLAPVLAEITQSRALSDTEQHLSDAVVARLSAQARTRTEASLYDGLAGDATALAMLAPGTEAAPLQRVAALMTPAGWPTTSGKDGSDAPLTDIIMGSAGIVLAATWAGGEHAGEIAAGGGEALLAAADRTEAGLDWGSLPGAPSRGPNYSHGTAGIATALAMAGALLDRADFVEAAVQGARHLLAVGSLDDDGFIVPHTIPPANRVVEPVTYTWCHGPTGTSHLFTALAHAGVSDVAGLEVTDLRRRCLHSVLTSGVPQRLRPGFWDNDGRCCGTAGVGDVLLDAAQDSADPGRRDMLMAAARTMGDALVERVIRDEDGARWRFIEHRQDPPLLPPGTSWMQGAGGIAAFLLRLARVLRDGPDSPVVDRPDQWWAVPARLRTVRARSAAPEQGS
jgi:hypothetical protein